MDVASDSLFKSWLADHAGIVRKVARAYARSADDAEDLAQEILLQLWRSARRYEARAAATTWIYRVALNTALGWSRKERRRRDDRAPIVGEVPAREAPGVEHAMARESVDRLYAAIHELPAADVALVLVYLDGLSYRQIADIFGISENAVGARLNRARQALREKLREPNHDA